MLSSERVPGLDRRALLRSAILLVGGTVAGLPSALLAQAAAGSPRFFTPAQFATMAEFADTIIPATDTPGAKGAGVPDFIDSLMVNWASKARQAQFRALVESMDASAQAATGKPLVALAPTQRLEVVRAFDEQRLQGRDEVYTKFKELVLTLYYYSEVGATQELRYELIPGKWEPGIEITPETRAWAVEGRG